jgi:L-fuculose-phosphate aldolase
MHPQVKSVVHVHPRFTVMMSVLQSKLVPMCNEGIELVKRPLPVYRHNKIVQSEAEGRELAEVLGDSKAVLLLGHGAATVGTTQAESFLNMYNLEEQARMNWYAYCAAGPDHPGIPDDLLAERGIPRSELPHFHDAAEEIGERVPGVWAYYTTIIERRMKDEGLIAPMIQV